MCFPCTVPPPPPAPPLLPQHLSLMIARPSVRYTEGCRKVNVPWRSKATQSQVYASSFRLEFCRSLFFAYLEVFRTVLRLVDRSHPGVFFRPLSFFFSLETVGLLWRIGNLRSVQQPVSWKYSHEEVRHALCAFDKPRDDMCVDDICA